MERAARRSETGLRPFRVAREAAISAAMAAAAAAAAQAEAEQLQRQQRSDALYTALSEKRTAGKARESAKKHAASASESERE